MTHPASPHVSPHKLARLALFGFIVTFLVARSCVFLIMAREMPNLYFFAGKVHVHHLNYGIFLLSAIAGYSVLRRPNGRAAELTALLYGVAMALTFDEFGMWLHLGGSYWQRTSVDAVIAVAAIIALIAYFRTVVRFESRHFWVFGIVAAAVIAFIAVVLYAGDHIGQIYGPKLRDLEEASSP